MSMRLPGVMAALVLAVAPGGRAFAATATGSVLTNVAGGSFSSSAGTQFDISYCATRVLLVQNPTVTLQKSANPVLQASGGDVAFKMWVVNISVATSAFNVTVTDRLPANMTYVSPSMVSWNGTWVAECSADNVSWNAGEPADGQEPPYYMRWILESLGINSSAFVEFKARIL